MRFMMRWLACVEKRIRTNHENDANDNKLIQTLQGRKSFAIEENNQEEDAYYLRNFIASVCPDLREEEQTKAEIVFRFCDYIFIVRRCRMERKF